MPRRLRPRDRAFQRATATASSTATAFRRLVYKTQVFSTTRATCSAPAHAFDRGGAAGGGHRPIPWRSTEDPVEAIALAQRPPPHPFGHAGQDALNHCTSAPGRLGAASEHNLQSLRAVDHSEEQFAWGWLNLCFETREGILALLAAARRSRPPIRAAWRSAFSTTRSRSLEAQLCNLADEIAYNAQ